MFFLLLPHQPSQAKPLYDIFFPLQFLTGCVLLGGKGHPKAGVLICMMLGYANISAIYFPNPCFWALFRLLPVKTQESLGLRKFFHPVRHWSRIEPFAQNGMPMDDILV